jgi:hypothetical protein
MDYTLNAPFIRVFYNDREITDSFEDLKYTASEEDDDQLLLTVRSDDRTVSDRPEFQEGSVLQVTWGFIGTTQIARRKVKVADIDWSYDKNNITGQLVACELGVNLKFASSDQVYRNTSLVGMAKDMADKHGLKAKIEIPGREDSAFTNPKDSEQALENLLNLGEKITMAGGVGKYLPSPKSREIITADIKKIFEDKAKNKREVDSVSKSLYGLTYQDFVDQKRAGQAIDLISIQREIQMRRYLADMKAYPFIAQGNKTDRQMINEMGMKEVGGPFIAETRDDELIIRRRDWNKKPYITYEYGGPTGNLIDYKTDPKDRHYKQSSRNMTFGSWDPLSKTYTEGNTNAVNDATRASLSKYEKLFDNYKELVKKFPNAIVGFRDATKEVGSNKSFLSGNILGTSAISDETRVVKNLRIPIFAIDKLKVLENTVNELKGISPNKKVIDPNNDNITDAYQQASNLRNQADLKRNPITALVYGDIGLWPGEIITIIGVGKKYSGNHYITKVDHIVDPSRGYMTQLELARKGNNIVSDPNTDISTTELGKNRNKQIGGNAGDTGTKTITLK